MSENVNTTGAKNPANAVTDVVDSTTPAPAKGVMSPAEAVAWFLRDMAQVAGYMLDGTTKLSLYATYRPILTAPDPWYFAGVVALESCKICDLFPADEADEVLREIFARMDKVVGRDDTAASDLAFLVMGRLGMGSLLLHRKVPDNMLGKIMMILIGSPEAAAPHMPDDTAHEQIRAALKIGKPVWWLMFQRRYELRDAAPAPRLVPSTFAA
jgi:hypothetical protein